MTEEELQKLLNKSIKSTSVDFTDNVMEQIEKKPELLPVSIWQIGGFLIAIVFLAVIPVLFFYPFLENLLSWENPYQFGLLPVKTSGLIIVFILVNKALKMYDEWKGLHNRSIEAK